MIAVRFVFPLDLDVTSRSDCRKTPAFSMVYGSRGFLVYAKIDMVMGMLDKAGNRRNQIQMVDV
ncbi:hypothetical protein, partial [Candidatus Darwinibacter acetoxidans]